MNGTRISVAEEFRGEVDRLYERVYKDGVHRPLSLSEVESLDLGPLLTAQEALDASGPLDLSSLPLPDLLVLSHRIEALTRALAPFGRADGLLALRIASLKGQGPQGAYRKASKESQTLFGQNSLGQA